MLKQSFNETLSLWFESEQKLNSRKRNRDDDNDEEEEEDYRSQRFNIPLQTFEEAYEWFYKPKREYIFFEVNRRIDPSWQITHTWEIPKEFFDCDDKKMLFLLLVQTIFAKQKYYLNTDPNRWTEWNIRQQHDALLCILEKMPLRLKISFPFSDKQKHPKVCFFKLKKEYHNLWNGMHLRIRTTDFIPKVPKIEPVAKNKPEFIFSELLDSLNMVHALDRNKFEITEYHTEGEEVVFSINPFNDFCDYYYRKQTQQVLNFILPKDMLKIICFLAFTFELEETV